MPLVEHGAQPREKAPEGPSDSLANYMKPERVLNGIRILPFMLAAQGTYLASLGFRGLMRTAPSLGRRQALHSAPRSAARRRRASRAALGNL
jgi:hypothetical protein